MELDMTKGSPTKIIVKYFIPLLLGNLLQQLYGIIDSIVIGKYVGTEAFAAVGASGAVTLFVTSILLGLAMGSSAIFSKLYGAHDYEKLKKSISTSLIFLFVVSLFVSIFASLFLPSIIVMFKIPPETAAFAYDYMKYVFYGFLFVGMYNAFSFVLRAFGDSRTPLYLLFASCILNLVLDLVFVILFDMGTAGAAIATLLTQAFSAITCAWVMFRRLRFIDFKISDLKFDRDSFSEIATYSILTAFQQSISSFGMMLVQGLVNTFGASTMAAFAAVSKVDSMASAPLQDLGNSYSTYTAQNLGAKKTERIKEGFKVTALMIVGLSLVMSILAYVFAPSIMLLFVDETAVDVINIGIHYLRIVPLFYTLLGFVVMFYGFFRGLGKIKISIVMTIVSQGLRVILAYSLAPIGGFIGICYAVVIGWFMTDILGFVMAHKVMRDKKSKIVD